MVWWKYILFIIVTIAAYAGLLFWFARRFVRFLPISVRHNWILGGLAALYPIIYLFRRIDRVTRFEHLEGVLTGFYLVMVLFLIMAFLVLVRDCLWWAALGIDRGLVRFAGRRVLPEAPEKRLELLQLSTLAVAGLAFVLLAVGVHQALAPPVVREVTVRDDRMPPALDGLRIAVVSDLHVGPTLGRAHVARVVRTINAQNADLVVIVGDLVDGPWAAVEPMLAPLAELNRPACFVSGNHELYWGWPDWRTGLTALGLTVLSNNVRVFERGQARWLLGGIPDRQRWSGGPQPRDPGPELSLRDAPPADYRILLAHRPTAASPAAEAGYHLMIAGHTHGGQFFPLTLISPFLPGGGAGLSRHGALRVFVSTGAGFWGPPVRLFNPPEVVVLTLRR